MSEQVVPVTTQAYASPTIEGPFQVYETPMLLDIEDAASCNWGCITSGSSSS